MNKSTNKRSRATVHSEIWYAVKSRGRIKYMYTNTVDAEWARMSVPRSKLVTVRVTELTPSKGRAK